MRGKILQREGKFEIETGDVAMSLDMRGPVPIARFEEPVDLVIGCRGQQPLRIFDANIMILPPEIEAVLYEAHR